MSTTPVKTTRELRRGEDFMLTTEDNPYNPYTDWDQWLSYDHWSGNHTCEYLDLVMNSSDDLSPADQALDYEDAIEEILELNVTGKFCLVYNTSGT